MSKLTDAFLGSLDSQDREVLDFLRSGNWKHFGRNEYSLEIPANPSEERDEYALGTTSSVVTELAEEGIISKQEDFPVKKGPPGKPSTLYLSEEDLEARV